MILDTYWQLLVGLTFASFVMFVLWLMQLVTHDAGIVDVGWSGTVGLLAVFYGSTVRVDSWRALLVVAMASLWAFRLAGYLLRDRVLGKSEDGRYQKLRAGFGSWAQLFFFAFFQFQGLLAWLFSLAFWLAIQREGALDVWDLAGCIVWIVAFVGETVADLQLARFRANDAHHGKTCRQGLWNYSRHPNYFFEWLHWWSYVLIAWPTPLGWITLFAPALMLFFLFKVTGIPATEARALINRGDDYRDYQRTTSVFVPWPSKKRAVE